ncbi:MAG: MBL fold metallo-hydrolase [Bacilli bacterium]|jgi:glyoxylase-like metal-dependent hydrolase (beta-lactamase superfamily II)|nr:MBL fold metallo-hydrolase [Bacilli bacterium]
MNFNVINPYPFVYHFRDPQGVCFSIIKGKDKAIVVDCGYGIFNIRELIENYIDTPYMVICTHGHMDHSSGGFLFDKIYLPEKDIELYKKHNSTEKRTKNIVDAISKQLITDEYDKETYINMPLANYEIIEIGTVIDLGDMHVEIIGMEGHTKGSIGLLVKEHKLLFTGDAAISMIWMFLEESTDKATYIEMLKRVMKLDFTHFITGHLMTVFEKKIFEHYLEVAIEAKPENSERVTFHNFERPNTFQYAKKFNDLNIGICYQEPKE